jgi:hypothetical protein
MPMISVSDAANKYATNAGGAGQEWQAGAARTGWLGGVNRPESVTAYNAGVSGKGKAKWTAAMNTWFPIFNALSDQIAQMPRNTPQDSINRVAAWINGTIAAKQQL